MGNSLDDEVYQRLFEISGGRFDLFRQSTRELLEIASNRYVRSGAPVVESPQQKEEEAAA